MIPSGTQLTDWVLTIINGAASAASVTLANPVTGETAHWANTLNANEHIRFDSARQIVEVSTNGGSTWTRRNENLTGLIPRLKGGIENAVTYAGPTTGSYSYTYTAKG